MRGIHKGFTLIELLVVIAIIGTLVAVLLPQLSNFNRGQTLKNAAADLQSNIRKTQNNASSGLNCNSNFKDTASGWKIDFVQGGASYNVSAICSGGNVGISTAQPFPSGITISQINVGTLDCSPVSAVFSNISSVINFEKPATCAVPVNTNSMSIFLNDTNAIGIGSTVVIEKGGAVY